MDNQVHLPFIQSFPADLVITRNPESLSIVQRIPCAYCLAVLCHMNTPSNKFSHLSSIHSSQVDSCMSPILEIPFDLPKILSILLLLKFLIACIMVNPISLVILLTSIVIVILSLLFRFVANARNPQTDPRIHPSGSDVVLIMNWFSPIKLSSIVPLSLLNLPILDQSVCF